MTFSIPIKFVGKNVSEREKRIKAQQSDVGLFLLLTVDEEELNALIKLLIKNNSGYLA